MCSMLKTCSLSETYNPDPPEIFMEREREKLLQQEKDSASLTMAEIHWVRGMVKFKKQNIKTLDSSSIDGQSAELYLLPRRASK